MRSLVLAALLALVGCDDGRSVTPDTSSPDGATSDTATTDSAPADTTKDSTPADGALCVNWEDMGIDCCDVCTEIYVTCKQTVKDQQGNPLTGTECLEICGTTGQSYFYVTCMMKVDNQVKCDPATLQACFDEIFQ
jgi:hypothetical protein